MAGLESFVINLPQRTDRWDQFKEEVKWIGLTDVMVMDGVIDKPARRGIGTAHTNCIRYAKAKGLDAICILEDDVVFQAGPRTIPYFMECMQNQPRDWDILLGGCYQKSMLAPFNTHWDRALMFSGLHFYIVNKSCYDKLLTWNTEEHYDRWISKQNLSIFVTKKFIAHQRDGYSDNAGEYTKYNDEFLDRSKLLK